MTWNWDPWNLEPGRKGAYVPDDRCSKFRFRVPVNHSHFTHLALILTRTGSIRMTLLISNIQYRWTLPITYYLLECSDEFAQGDGSLSFNAYRSVSSSPPIAQYCNVAVVHFKIHTYFHLTAFRSGEHLYLPKSAVTLGQHDFNLSDRTSSFKV